MPISELATVHPTASVDPTAVVHANARVGAFAVIGKHCVIQHLAEIGAGSQLGDGVWAYTAAVVGKGCTIGDAVQLPHGSVTPDGSDIVSRDRGFSPFQLGAYLQMGIGALSRSMASTLQATREAQRQMDALGHVFVGMDFGALELKAVAHHDARMRASWGGVAEPASNRFLNPDHKPRVKDIARPWDKAPR
jgi:carbonic anhydrase/acetyltransferase-like protein (isoleucine patch superfamily)